MEPHRTRFREADASETTMNEDLTRLFSKSRLLGRVREADLKLYNYVLESCDRVLPTLRQIPDAFGEYTDHGERHSKRVFQLGEKLIDNLELDPWEVAVFTLACYYHDVGMACPRAAWDELESSEGFRREANLIREFVLPGAGLRSEDPEVLRAHTITEYLRRHHGPRGRRWIQNNWPNDEVESFINDVYLWDQVARVGIGHTLDVNEVESDAAYERICPIGPAIEIDVLLLTCLLRLSDICHLSRDRALPYVRRTLTFTSGLSEDIWRSLEDVAGASCDPERSVIVVRGEPRDFELHRLVHEAVMGIKRELENCHRLLAGGVSLPWKLVDATQVRPAPGADYKFVEQGRFRLNEDKIVRLLMGARLYAEPLYALRECVQNSLDAISIVRLEQPQYEGRILVRYIDSEGDHPVLEIFDNGTGMDEQVVIDYLLSAGSRPFVQSERRAQDWGELQEESTFIARHGIGFLSCFMIASEVEVFSYYRGGEPLRVKIDSPTRNVKFFKTDRTEGFPNRNVSDLSLPTPWQAGHGTCVRLHLSEPIEMTTLMEFIATNLPRVGAQLIVIYNSDEVSLRENWRRNQGWSSSLEETTLADLEEDLFGPEVGSRTGYEGPPQDQALDSTLRCSDNLRGIVTLMPETGSSSVLTQDGILIREGATGIWLLGRQPGGAEPPFYFNVDVTGGLQLELDAERARILDTQQNRDRCRVITDWIEENGLTSLGVLQNSLYFPCGGDYYHGGVDLIQHHGDPSFYFHRSLRKWYTRERLRDAVQRYGEGPFLSARLYLKLGTARCTPVGLRELNSEDQYLLTLGRTSFDGGIGGILRDEVERDQDQDDHRDVQFLLDELRGLVSLDDLLYVFRPREFFALPLLCMYQTRSTTQLSSADALLIHLRRRNSWCLPDEEEVDSLESSLLASESW